MEDKFTRRKGDENGKYGQNGGVHGDALSCLQHTYTIDDVLVFFSLIAFVSLTFMKDLTS